MAYKVAVVSLSLSRLSGGLFQSVRKLAMNTCSARFNITAIGATDDYSIQDECEWKPIQVNNYRRTLAGAYGVSFGMLRALFGGGYDLIHLHGIWNFTSVLVLIISVIRKTPFIVSPHGMCDKWILGKSRFKKIVHGFFVERLLFKRAAFVHALNESEASSVRSFCPDAKIFIAPNGIDLTQYSSSDEASAKKVLLYIGRIDQKKGLIELVQAWSLLDRRDNWILVIRGWGNSDYIERLRSEIVRLNVQGVDFGGAVYGREKHALLLNASAFILPSFSEGLPMAVLEAWAYGVPVFMTRECNLPDGFERGAAAEISYDSGGRLIGLDEIFECEIERLHVMGQAGLSLVSEKYSWSQVGKQFDQLYIEAIVG